MYHMYVCVCVYIYIYIHIYVGEALLKDCSPRPPLRQSL